MTEIINTHQSTKAAPRWLEITALSISPYVNFSFVHEYLDIYALFKSLDDHSDLCP